jgi:hypothetical protein
MNEIQISKVFNLNNGLTHKYYTLIDNDKDTYHCLGKEDALRLTQFELVINRLENKCVILTECGVRVRTLTYLHRIIIAEPHIVYQYL